MTIRALLPAAIRTIVALGVAVATFVGGPSQAGAAERAPEGVPEVVVIGDSITADNVPQLRRRLDDAELAQVRFEAVAGRRIAEAFEWNGWRSSGLDAIESVHASGVDPDLWIVELGTNEIFLVDECRCRDQYVVARRLIDRVVEAIGPGEPILWVNVVNHQEPPASRVFNAALRSRSAQDPAMTVLDWRELAAATPEWFSDHVHPNGAGADALADLYIDGIDTWLDEAPRTLRLA